MIVEVLGLVFCTFALSRVVLRFREGRVSWGMMIFWTLAWFIAMVFILNPVSFEPISKAIGIQRPLDLMIIAALMMGYYLTFRVYIYVEELRSDISKIASELALKEEK
jgi:hypothetical protein